MLLVWILMGKGFVRLKVVVVLGGRRDHVQSPDHFVLLYLTTCDTVVQYHIAQIMEIEESIVVRNLYFVLHI